MSTSNDPSAVEHQTLDQHTHERGTAAYRREVGKALRKKAPRRSHAEWSPAADRPDPISLMEERKSNQTAASYSAAL